MNHRFNTPASRSAASTAPPEDAVIVTRGQVRVGQVLVEAAADPRTIEVPPRITWTALSDGLDARIRQTHVAVFHQGDEVWSSTIDGPRAASGPAECPRELLAPDSGYDVRVTMTTDGASVQGAGSFRTGLFDGNWHQAEWISAPPSLHGPAPLLRAEFDVLDPRNARLYLAVGGFARVLLNGHPVGGEVLTPGITDYDARVQYVSWDVTPALRVGRNALTIELGRGFYGISSPNIWAWERAPWHDEPCAKLLLLVGEDGTAATRSVVSDGHLFRATSGPTHYDDVYGGETYVAADEPTDAAVAGFDATRWLPAATARGPRGQLVGRSHQPIRVIRTIPGKVVTRDGDRIVLDFGTVLAGWVRVRARGERGHRLTMGYGEKLEGGRPNDTDILGYYSGRFQRDEFVLAGTGGIEEWEPRFSWKGFRYVEVEGWLGPDPASEDIVARVAHTDVAVTGGFESSDATLTDIHRLTVSTILSNLHSIPTDTPKFEKNGWTADGMLGTPTFLLNLDARQLLAKWLDDIADARDADGAPRVIAPHGGWEWDWSPAPPWHAAYVLIPWWLYQHDGDLRILARHFEGILAYLDLEYRRSPGGIATTTLGDWMTPETPATGANPPEDLRVPATAYLHLMLMTAAAIADALGALDGELLRARAAEVRRAFLREFYDPVERIVRGDGDEGFRQSHNLLALAFGILPAEDEADAVDAIVRDVRARGTHLNTGILSTKELLPVLTRHGRADLALALARQRTFPSWGWWLENGATSLWEHWHTDSRSQNHYFFGTVDEWFYTAVAGIERADIAWRHIRFEPRLLHALDWAAAHVDTPQGTAGVAWRRAGTHVTLTATVPVGATGEIVLPASAHAPVLIDDRDPAGAPGVRTVVREGDLIRITVGSGIHLLSCDVGVHLVR